MATHCYDFGKIVPLFALEGECVFVQPLGNGLINDTFKVTTMPEGTPDYVLQRINTSVFRDVPLMQDNILRITSHIRTKLQERGADDIGRRTLTVVPARDGALFAGDGDGGCWRMTEFIPRTKTLSEVTPESAYLTGKAFGDFQKTDHTMTMIRTENGQTIHLQHDVMNPRPYSRMYQLVGTEGYASKYPVSGYTFRSAEKIDGVPDHENLSMHSFVPQDVKEALMEKYKHPIHIELEEIAKKVGGHGGMDFVMDYRLVYCLRNGLPLDQDVYDAAEWSCIGALNRISIAHGSMPVEVPDFTRGAWKKLSGYHHYMSGE